MQDTIDTRSKKNQQPLIEGLSETRRKRRIRTSRELFPPPEILLQPSLEASNQSIEEMVEEEPPRRFTRLKLMSLHKLSQSML